MMRRMPALSANDLTPQMLVLGLVIQQPDTVAGIGRRLADEFASARFSRSSAYKNLPPLADQGYVRLVEEGESRSLNVYEATTKGVKYFQKWLGSTRLPPMIRDVLHVKLKFLAQEDIVELLEVVREEEHAYTKACEIAQTRVLQEQRWRRRKRAQWDWCARLRHIQRKDEVNLWSLMSLRLERLREDLEELLEEASAARDEAQQCMA
jgi:DNA-binding PadR family transcriptional regulator